MSKSIISRTLKLDRWRYQETSSYVSICNPGRIRKSCPSDQDMKRRTNLLRELRKSHFDASSGIYMKLTTTQMSTFSVTPSSYYLNEIKLNGFRPAKWLLISKKNQKHRFDLIVQHGYKIELVHFFTMNVFTLVKFNGQQLNRGFKEEILHSKYVMRSVNKRRSMSSLGSII